MLASANCGHLERNDVSRRYDYRRMTAEEFRTGLEQIRMPPLAFGRIFGFEEKRIRQWATGEQEVPIWVFPVLQILKNVSGAIPEARQAAAEIIIRDNFRPQDGEYPFLAKEGDDAN